MFPQWHGRFATVAQYWQRTLPAASTHSWLPTALQRLHCKPGVVVSMLRARMHQSTSTVRAGVP